MSHVHVPTTEPIQPARLARPRDWAALAVLMLPVLLTSIDNTVLSFALPQVTADLRPTGTQLLWIVDLYPLMLAGFLIAAGSLGDRVGRRRLLVLGAVGFGVASLVAAFSTTPQMLLGARALLGFFGAALMPSTLSLIRNIFEDAAQRRVAIATWAAMFSGGAALGPILGGWLLEHYWWGSVFLINAPIIVAFVVLALVLLPESRDPSPGPIDVPSIVLSLTAMLPLTFAIKKAAESGITDVVVLAVVVGVASVLAFVRRQRRLVHPMIDLALFRNRVFTGAITANLLSLMGFAGFMFFAAQFLQLVMGLSPLASAVALLPGLVVTVLAGFVAVRLVRHVPVHLVVAGSFVLSAAGYAIAAFGDPTTGSIMLAFAVLGIGIGLAETLTNDLMLAGVPAHKAGAASALSETAYEIGAVLGTAVLGSVLTQTFRRELQVPAYAEDATGHTFETLGGTLERAALFPNEIGESLRASAIAAFDHGVQLTSAAAILVALTAAWMSLRMLRDAPRG